MKQSHQNSSREIVALKVRQWLKEWDKVTFDAKEHRGHPDPHFYIFTLPASDLKALSGIQRRTTQGGLLRSKDLGIQRRHDESRSKEITEFIHYGYPWSDLSESKRKSGQYNDLLKPGWLPTSIVVNILKPSDMRHGQSVSEKDIITIDDSKESIATIRLPQKFTGHNWKPSLLHPIEVIDGQHRLWAFEGQTLDDNFELPVVAFHGLDISWQAYLFWTINIKPKRINASLAFDIYPLLRAEDWFEKFEGHSIYRETRAQELVEALWANPESPWYHRINMLGEPGLKQAMVSQAAWIRSLMATYVKAWEGKQVKIGGLFGAKLGSNKEVLPWSRAQQAAFLILMGQKISDAIKKCKEPWAECLRKKTNKEDFEQVEDLAFAGHYTLLNTDQGIRAILYITNDLCYVCAEKLKLETWVTDLDSGTTDESAVSEALKSVEKQEVAKWLENIVDGLATYDWRTSAAPNLKDDERTLKAAFRGSGGYKELRLQLLRHLANQKGDIGNRSKDVLTYLGY